MSVCVRVRAKVKCEHGFARIELAVKSYFLQKYPGIDWAWQVEPHWSVGEIRDKFCIEHTLEPRIFCLYHNGSNLNICPDLLVSEVGRAS